MTGNFKTSSDNESDAKHISVEFILDNKKSVYYKDYRKFGRVYYFNDLEHWGISVDQMIASPDFQALVSDANELGTLTCSRLLVDI